MSNIIEQIGLVRKEEKAKWLNFELLASKSVRYLAVGGLVGLVLSGILAYSRLWPVSLILGPFSSLAVIIGGILRLFPLSVDQKREE